MKGHRFLEKIDKGIKKGVNNFFIYGKGLKDYFLFDDYLGIQELRETLFYYFLTRLDKFGFFVEINESGADIKVFNKNGKSISLKDALNIIPKRGGFGANINSSSNMENEAREATNSAQSRAENNLKYLLENINNKKLFVFIKDVEWQSGIYSNERNINFIKFIFDFLNKSKESVLVASMNDIDALKEFGIEIEKDSSIYIGMPSIEELKRAYLRYSLIQDIDINMLDFNDIVTALKGNKRSLKEAIKILKIKNKNNLELEDFKDVIDLNVNKNIYLKDVILPHKIKDVIINEVESFLNKKDSKKGIILYGPPGTGKTHIARAIANEYKMYFLAPTLADLKGEFVGQSSKKVKEIFEEARANAPTILFLDEIDTIFRKRGGHNTDSYVEDMVNQFLVEIDGANSKEGEIFIIAATNRLEEIDLAIRSRLSKEIKIDNPDKEAREKILDLQFKDFKFSLQPYKDEILDKLEGFSGRDLENLAKSVKNRVASELDIEKEDFIDALEQIEENFIREFVANLGGAVKIVRNEKMNFSDLIGNDYVKHALQEEVNYIKMSKEEKERMKQFGIRQRKGTILYGPPGNGKTTFAKALAGENNFIYVEVSSKNFINIDDALYTLDLVFENSIKLSKMTSKDGVVLFFDEVDALIAKGLNPAFRGTILKYLEGEIRKDDSKVILIAATNMNLKDLDEAIIREGRFDNKLWVGGLRKDKAIKVLKRMFLNDKHLDVRVKDDFYEKLLSNYFSKEDDTISIAKLKTIKENKKREMFNKGKIEYNKIVIE